MVVEVFFCSSSVGSGGGRSRSYSTGARPQARPYTLLWDFHFVVLHVIQLDHIHLDQKLKPDRIFFAVFVINSSARNSARAPPRAAAPATSTKKEAPKPEPKQTAPSQPAPQPQVHYCCVYIVRCDV